MTCWLSLGGRGVETLLLESQPKPLKLEFLLLCQVVQMAGERICIGSVGGDSLQVGS